MRTQDGHPRGFGYVTLDSPSAAERCLQEPQLIDNRIVDMKLAVPEGSGTMGLKGTNFNTNVFAGQADFSMDMFTGHEFSEWSDASAPYNNALPWCSEDQALDCLELLCAPRMPSPHSPTFHSESANQTFLPEYAEYAEYDYPEFAAQEDPLDGMGLLLPPVLSCEPQSSTLPANYQQLVGAPLQMSATAPEFVPLGTQSMQQSRFVVATDPPAALANSTSNKSTKSARKAGTNRAPLGELTNIVQAEDLLEPFKSPTKKNSDMGHGHLSPSNANQQAAAKEDTADLPNQDGVRRANLFLDDEALNEQSSHGAAKTQKAEPEKVEVDESLAVGVSQEETAERISPTSTSSGETIQADMSEVDLDSLPSVGSALHFARECKRCNFFAKGRCQNGKDCSFCHFPHDKRKLSRQEKRERRSAWLSQEGIQEDNIYEDEDAQNEDAVASFVFGNQFTPFTPSDVIGQTAPLPPPGLAPWEAEAMPAAFFGHCNFQQIVSSAPLTSVPGMVLSTAPSPAMSVASTPLSTTPMPTPTAATAVNAEARTMFQGSLLSTTASTQTGKYLCNRCELDEGKAEQDQLVSGAVANQTSPKYDGMSDHLGNQWGRDELLRLRGVLLKMPAFDQTSRSIPIRTAAASECI